MTERAAAPGEATPATAKPQYKNADESITSRLPPGAAMAHQENADLRRRLAAAESRKIYRGPRAQAARWLRSRATRHYLRSGLYDDRGRRLSRPQVEAHLRSIIDLMDPATGECRAKMQRRADHAGQCRRHAFRIQAACERYGFVKVIRRRRSPTEQDSSIVTFTLCNVDAGGTRLAPKTQRVTQGRGCYCMDCASIPRRRQQQGNRATCEGDCTAGKAGGDMDEGRDMTKALVAALVAILQPPIVYVLGLPFPVAYAVSGWWTGEFEPFWMLASILSIPGLAWYAFGVPHREKEQQRKRVLRQRRTQAIDLAYGTVQSTIDCVRMYEGHQIRRGGLDSKLTPSSSTVADAVRLARDATDIARPFLDDPPPALEVAVSADELARWFAALLEARRQEIGRDS